MGFSHTGGGMRYDFYGVEDELTVSHDTPHRLVKENVECLSGDALLGWYKTPGQCADAVKDDGGKFFIYGRETGDHTGHGFTYGPKKGLCYKEDTTSEQCPEGWEKDAYDFYAIDDD